MLKRGLTLGKYAPLHKGHQLVIETGLSEMDEMLVIIYDAPETEIPLAVRANWIRSLYPDVQVIEAWDGPTEVGYSSSLMREHERYVIETLGVTGVTHFYSSEQYGEHMSIALGAIDRRVDDNRSSVPISASKIRNQPYEFRNYLDPIVYQSMITNVVLLGAPCSGKTTLAERLSKEFDTQWMPEYGREYWEAHQVNHRLRPDQLMEIAEQHLDREAELIQQANRYIFTDTNALTTAHFARYYHGNVDPALDLLSTQAVARYDLFILCDIDFPYEDTWDRSGDVNREEFQKEIVCDLNQRGISFISLSGSVEDRVMKVRSVLSKFDKYMDANNLSPGKEN